MTLGPPRDFAGVVVAAGSSSRFGDERPKQFQRLGDTTVLERAVRSLTVHPDVRGVVVVLSLEEVDGPRGRAIRDWDGVIDVVAGGSRRADSVARGVDAAGDVPFVLVHDAARPLAGFGLVDSVIQATRQQGAAVPGLAIPDTVKRIDADGRVEETLDRTALRLAQTPQGSRTDWIRAALERTANDPSVTDEASALEIAGRRVAVVPGDPANRKITTRDDLVQARHRLGGINVDIRVGTGFDIHRRDPDRRLVLGGVEFMGEPGLEGHSDADVVLHAAMDAVLGAAGLGDIGVLFPPEEIEWKDADSRDLSRRVAAALDEAGFAIVNLDLTLLAERPKIRPRGLEMREAIAACFGIPLDRVGLKATTLETLGALGRDEGVACQAAALIRRKE